MNKKKKLVNKKHRKTKLRLKSLKVSSLAKKKKVVKVSKPPVDQTVEQPKTTTVVKPVKKTVAKKTTAKKTTTKKTTAKK